MKLKIKRESYTFRVTSPQANIVMWTFAFFWNRFFAGLMLALLLLTAHFAPLIGIIVGLMVRFDFHARKNKPETHEETKR